MRSAPSIREKSCKFVEVASLLSLSELVAKFASRSGTCIDVVVVLELSKLLGQGVLNHEEATMAIHSIVHLMHVMPKAAR